MRSASSQSSNCASNGLPYLQYLETFHTPMTPKHGLIGLHKTPLNPGASAQFLVPAAFAESPP